MRSSASASPQGLPSRLPRAKLWPLASAAKARDDSLASRGRHCQLPGIWANQAASATRSTGDICRLEASPTAPMACAARRPASATSVAEDDQAVVVLAHAELAVAEFVQRHVHLGDLAGHHVVAGDQLVALQFERAHGLAPRQDREALRLDELAGFVEQRVQDAGLDRVGVFLDVHQGRVAALVAVAQFELVAAEGQARGRQRAVQRAGGHRDRRASSR